jgi:hypothetical protein
MVVSTVVQVFGINIANTAVHIAPIAPLLNTLQVLLTLWMVHFLGRVTVNPYVSDGIDPFLLYDIAVEFGNTKKPFSIERGLIWSF